MATKKTYHHGDLRAALVQAADEIIAEVGIEGFSLRAAAARAGVSPAAPAHHFGNARGLLTEVALLAFERMGRALEAAGRRDDVAVDVRALGLAFVSFAVENPGHFRLMFRGDLINRDDARYPEAAYAPGMRLGLAIAAYHGRTAMNLENFEETADIFGGLAALHGLAHLILEEKIAPFFEKQSPRDFVRNELPRVLERMYPARDVAAPASAVK